MTKAPNLITANNTVTIDADDLMNAFDLAVEVRNAQMQYFHTRTNDSLAKAKALEHQFDTLARKMFAGPDLLARAGTQANNS